MSRPELLCFTLHQQVVNWCEARGWPKGAAQDAADDAVEMVGSNKRLSTLQLSDVLMEVCRSDGDAAPTAGLLRDGEG